jgi:hypothetical protein
MAMKVYIGLVMAMKVYIGLVASGSQKLVALTKVAKQ